MGPNHENRPLNSIYNYNNCASAKLELFSSIFIVFENNERHTHTHTNITTNPSRNEKASVHAI